MPTYNPRSEYNKSEKRKKADDSKFESFEI